MSDIIVVADKNGRPMGGYKRPGFQANTRSVLSDRLALGRYGTSHAGERDYYSILGYPRDLTLDDYMARFERDPLAGTIIEFPADETWRDTPTVKDGRDKDAKDDTSFAQAWSDFAERMRVYHYCQRVDTLAGIGRFGILLIGVAGGAALDTPIESVNRLEDVLYLRPYSEQSVEVAEYEDDPGNARYGLPRIYNVTLSDIAGTGTAKNLSTRKQRVHASRVIHVAEGLLENEVYGRPRLQRVFNLLDDLLKLVGGAAEATWKLMRKGFVLDIDPEAEISAAAAADLEEQFTEYDHGLRRFMKTRGMTVNDLGSEVVDPKGPFEVIISLISAATGIPQRILLGSERGELASSQDASNWAGRIASRQLNWAEPVILRPLIDRLIAWGALQKPSAARYTVVWDALFELTDGEKAVNAKLWAEAYKAIWEATGQRATSVEEFRGEHTPLPEELPDTMPEEPEPVGSPLGPVVPDALPGQDVLEQVGELVGNAGYTGKERAAIVNAAARILARGL